LHTSSVGRGVGGRGKDFLAIRPSLRGGEAVKVVAFTGMPGSGKSEAVRVALERGAQVLRMGDLVWEEVRRRGLPMEASVVGHVADEMRRTDGPDVWARRTLQAVDRGAALVVIDGLRSPAELEAFRAALGRDLVVARIDCPDEVRLARVTGRAREDDTATREAFEERDRRELGWGLAEVLARADRAIPNEGTVEELQEAVGALLDGLAG
jgi:dephospho-CoA kinase